LIVDINGRAQDNGVRKYGAQEEVWKLEHNEDHHKMYSSPIIWVVKMRRMQRAGVVVHLGEEKCIVWLGKPEGKRPLGKSRNIRGFTLDLTCDGRVWRKFIWLRIR
jgi:hypothetical protein